MAGRRDGGLSSEQIRRMEENRRLAQQRLSNKRALAVGSTSQALRPSSSSSLGYSATSTQRSQYDLPPAKRAAINPGPSTHQCVPQERKVIGPPPKSMPMMSEYSYLGSSGQSSAAATTGNAGSLVRLMDSSAASSSYQCPSQVAGGSSSFAASTVRGQQGGTTFYSSDRGAPGSSATMRGAGAVSSSAPSTSSQKVISVILIVCDCSWVHLYLLVGSEP